MVCVGAAEGFSADFPCGTKHRSATASACAPEMRITARPPSPSGVAIAAIVSSSMDSVSMGGQILGLEKVLRKTRSVSPPSPHDEGVGRGPGRGASDLWLFGFVALLF